MNLKKCVKDVDGLPMFSRFVHRDINPLGRSDKMRLIHDPNPAMRDIHGRFIRELRKLKIDLRYARGARPGDSIRANVEAHRKNRYFYLLDIQDAYKHVDRQRLITMLQKFDRHRNGPEAIAEFLDNYCLDEKGGLVMGAPASPDLFNLYCHEYVDIPMSSVVLDHNLTYTRYLDDLTFSAVRPIGGRKRLAIRTVVKKAAFEISHKKSIVADLKRGPIRINGIWLTQDGRIILPRSYIRKIRGLIHTAMKRPNDTSLHAQIEGLMGLFKDIQRNTKPNAVERDLMARYGSYRDWFLNWRFF